MDLNPDAREHAAADVSVIEADCSQSWPQLELDVVFTSNFLEHLPTKDAVLATLRNACAALRPGGRLIAIGPNIRFLPGDYWDFFDHFVPLSDKSVCEALRAAGFKIDLSVPKFLPYTMSDGRRYPLAMLRAYLALPALWRVFGKQFLIVAQKPDR